MRCSAPCKVRTRHLLNQNRNQNIGVILGLTWWAQNRSYLTPVGEIVQPELLDADMVPDSTLWGNEKKNIGVAGLAED